MPEYRRPSWFERAVLNLPIALAARLGLSLGGANMLSVRGRSTGQWRAVPVNPVTVEGTRYLVAPRGDTHWVRNIRTNPEARLTLGRRSETIRVEETPDDAKAPVLKAYLDRWGNITHEHFGVSRHPTDDEIERIRSRSPVFRIVE